MAHLGIDACDLALDGEVLLAQLKQRRRRLPGTLALADRLFLRPGL